MVEVEPVKVALVATVLVVTMIQARQVAAPSRGLWGEYEAP